MDIACRFSRDGVTARELEALFQAANLSGRVGEKIRRAFVNSSLVCFAYDGSRQVGSGRALTDGEYHATVHDVAVLPEFQERGIGRCLMQHLLERHQDVMARFDEARLYDRSPRSDSDVH